MITAIVARNEADRYLDRVVRHHRQFGRVLVLDDHSTDDTAGVAERAGATVRRRVSGQPMWGHEAPVRQELWDWAASEAESDWVLICDADQLLMGDPRPLCTSWQVNTWCFKLYDCWDDEATHRADGYWRGFEYPRAWLFKPSAQPDDWTAEWGTRGIHVGHCPSNWVMVAGVAPDDIYWLHLGYLDADDRRAKYRQYRATWDHLSAFERAHAQSIVEE
jgi:glycosyltransferase involved in cell wall biosynthesis